MSKTLAWCIVIVAFGVFTMTTVYQPAVLSDRNVFLQGFVNHELLSFLGVIVAITLASAANLHLTLHKLDADTEQKFFDGTRALVRRSAYLLLWMMAVAFVVVVTKPMAVPPGGNETVESIFNSIGLLVVIINVLTLVDLTQTAFQIES